MASSTCHVVGGTKRVRVERTVRFSCRATAWWYLPPLRQPRRRHLQRPLLPVEPALWQHVRPLKRQSPSGLEGRSEEHTSELQSLMRTSYAGFCLKKQKSTTTHKTHPTLTHLNYIKHNYNNS